MTRFARLIACILTASAALSCDGAESKSSAAPSAPEHETSPDDSGTGAEPDCYEDAQTHREILNACTDAERVAKSPALPLLLDDGGLPPLP